MKPSKKQTGFKTEHYSGLCSVSAYYFGRLLLLSLKIPEGVEKYNSNCSMQVCIKGRVVTVSLSLYSLLKGAIKRFLQEESQYQNL